MRVVAALGGKAGQDEELVEVIELQQRTIKAQAETITALEEMNAIKASAIEKLETSVTTYRDAFTQLHQSVMQHTKAQDHVG
jgi:hypothetical protein